MTEEEARDLRRVMPRREDATTAAVESTPSAESEAPTAADEPVLRGSTGVNGSGQTLVKFWSIEVKTAQRAVSPDRDRRAGQRLTLMRVKRWSNAGRY
jgi:hypothetical protein